jgi:hypothetical protein
MFTDHNEGDKLVPSSWPTLSRPVQPGDSEVNCIDEKTNHAGRSDSAENERTDRTLEERSVDNELESSSSDNENCIGGICTLNWSPGKSEQRRDVA